MRTELRLFSFHEDSEKPRAAVLQVLEDNVDGLGLWKATAMVIENENESAKAWVALYSEALAEWDEKLSQLESAPSAHGAASGA